MAEDTFSVLETVTDNMTDHIGNRSITAKNRLLHAVPRSTNCYTCYNGCVYKVIESSVMFGVIANFIVLYIILKNKKLRTPTYMAIACLALSDAIFLTANVITPVEVVVRSLSCSFPLSYAGPFVATIKGFCWFAANAHLSIIAGVRYILLLHPLKAHIYLTNRRVLLSSACIWVLGIIIWMSVYALLKYGLWNGVKNLIFINGIWGIVYLAPLVVTILVHFQKLRHVRKSRQINLGGNRNNGAVTLRMSRIILLVIILATCLPLPKLVYTILVSTKVTFPSETFKMHCHNITLLLFFLNSAVNPFIYTLMSDPFKRRLKSMCFKDLTTQRGVFRVTR